MSGFRFCGMIDDPVVNESASRISPNSALLQRITSSQSRDRWTMQIAASARNSAMKSRAATASMLLREISSKPSSSATASRSSS